MAIIIDNSGGYNTTETDLTVVSTVDLEQGDTVALVDELIWVARVLDSTDIIVQRGYAGTTAAAIATTVFQFNR